jgi:predicted NUDIX family NTP pyrophosphohydrolase
MAKESAGLLLFRRRSSGLEVLLVHPGGPFWAKKDAGSWSIPKGELDAAEEPLATALREFEEETGHRPDGSATPLGSVKQAGGKIVHAWAVEGDLDPERIRSDTFTLEWPRGSGQVREFPEVDRAAWFGIEAARGKILPGQAPLIDRLLGLPSSGA